LGVAVAEAEADGKDAKVQFACQARELPPMEAVNSEEAV